MVDTGLNFASLIGLAELLLSLSYFITSELQVIKTIKNSNSSSLEKTMRILQVIFAPLFVFLSGSILIIQGWRLDAFFQFQQFIIFILLNYLIWRDWQASNQLLR